MKVVGRLEPFHLATELGINPSPVMLTVIAFPLELAESGLIERTAGVGFSTGAGVGSL